MTELRLDYSPDKARAVVSEAFRRTDGISEVEAGSHQVVGKTGIGFPRVLWSYGENVYVDFSEPTEEGPVPIEVWAEKAVWMNVTANPEKYKREFLSELDAIRGQSVDELEGGPFEDTASDSRGVGILGVVGYPISVLLGGFLGVAIAMAAMSTILGSVHDAGGLLGILTGAIAGGALWYHRDAPTVRFAGKYLGVGLLGVLLAGTIQTALGLDSSVGSALVLLFGIGFPIGRYVSRDRSRP